jgi:hypothetical protein
MERILSNPSLSSNMPNPFLPPKAIVTNQELIAWICMSLVETKQANSNVKLATKHCIFTAIVSVGPRASSARGIARMFSMPHQNVVVAILCRALMCDNGVPLWTLIVRNKRSDDIMPSTRHTIVNRWVVET